MAPIDAVQDRIAAVAEAQQAVLADALARGTALSEQGIIKAGEIVGQLVQSASTSREERIATLMAEQEGHRQAIAEAVQAQGALVQAYVDEVRPLYQEQVTLLDEATVRLGEVGDLAKRISVVSEATRILQLCTRVEIAHLDAAGSKFRSTAEEMAKLNDVTDQLNTTLHRLAEALEDLLPRLTRGTRQLIAGLDAFSTEVQSGLAAIEAETARLAERSSSDRDRADADREALVAASHEALSALQFQDRMIQDLQRVDSRLGELVAIARGGEPAESHKAFQANLGDLMADVDEDDPDAPLDDGELLLF